MTKRVSHETLLNSIQRRDSARSEKRFYFGAFCVFLFSPPAREMTDDGGRKKMTDEPPTEEEVGYYFIHWTESRAQTKRQSRQMEKFNLP